MARNHRGFTTRPKITALLRDAITPELAEHWTRVEAAFDKAADAHATAAEQRATATAAPEHDAQAARDAARAGKKPPAATAAATAIAATEAERYADALDDLANEQEAEFMHALRGERPVVADRARTALAAAVQDARTAIEQAQDATRRVGDLAGLWAWARRDDVTGMPVGNRLARDLGGITQELATFIAVADAGVAAEHPDAVAEREAAWIAEQQAALGVRSTPDGVVVDRASIGALRSMARD